MAESRSRALVQRRLLAPAQGLLRRVVLGVRWPIQELTLSSRRRLMRRWPLLSPLLGLVGPDSTSPSARPAQGVAPAERAKCLECLRASDDAAARARAARDLAHVVDPATSAALVAALRDPTAEVAVEAADALRQHPCELAAPALCDVLVNRDGYFSAAARATAVRALGELLPIGQGAPIGAAIADPDANVSLAAVAALAERDEEASAEALLSLLEDTTGFFLPLTRQAAARALARIGHGAEQRARVLLAHESDLTVRDALASVTAPDPS